VISLQTSAPDAGGNDKQTIYPEVFGCRCPNAPAPRPRLPPLAVTALQIPTPWRWDHLPCTVATTCESHLLGTNITGLSGRRPRLGLLPSCADRASCSCTCTLVPAFAANDAPRVTLVSSTHRKRQGDVMNCRGDITSVRTQPGSPIIGGCNPAADACGSVKCSTEADPTANNARRLRMHPSTTANPRRHRLGRSPAPLQAATNSNDASSVN